MARLLNDSPYLYGIHEPGGEQYMADAGMRGWILFTEAIGADPNDTGGKNFGTWADQGYGILVRLNHSYSPDGTIPSASRYGDFARRCANYVRNSNGAHIWIIGNEMNYSIERPGVRTDGDRLVNPGETILPSMYANCYRQCRNAIRGLAGHETDQVIVGAPAPWNSETKYDGNPDGDWCKYLADILTILGPSQCDGIAIHAYTHGANPEMIYNEYGMDKPFQNRQYNFRVYRDFMQAIPASMRALPVYLTEADQNDAWVDNNNGWIQRAYGEIDAWNKVAGNQKIRTVILYRWPKIDRWYIEGKAGVVEDFKQALTYKYNWEKYLQTQPDKPNQPDQPSQPNVPDTSPIAFPQTGKTARGAFAVFYRQYGLDITGYPISDEYTPSDSGLKTQDWQRLILEEYPAGSGKARLRLVGAEAAELRQKVTALQQQAAQLQQQIAQLRQQGGGPIEPIISDITNTLQRNPAGFFKRPLSAIQYIVISHTAARPDIGADRVAQAHLKLWPGIVGQFYITGDGQIQQTNPIDEVVAQNQSWIYNGISIYVAGNFSEAIPTEAQLTALAQLCAWLMVKYGLASETIKGAQELINTQSPGAQWRQGQNWKALLLDRVAAAAMQIGPTTPTNDAETANLRTQISSLQGQIAALQSQLQSLNGQIFELQDRNTALLVQLETLKTSTPTTRIAKPAFTDITQQLPRTASSLKSRSNDQIKYLVFNHTAVDASVGADKLAAAHQKRWGAILYHFFITGDGTIQQTNPLDQTIDLTQPWLAQGINIAVAGDFTAEAPAAAQINAAAALSAWLLQEYGLSVDAVKGVSEFISSQSPGAQWLQGKNWKGLLLARLAEVQKTAAPEPSTPNSATVLALQTQLRQAQQALSQAQAAISSLTTERDQWKVKAAQAADTSQLQQQINQLTQQLQAANNEKTALTQQAQGLTNDKATLSQQVQTLNTARTALTQQVQSLTNDKTVLNQQVTTLRGQVDPLQQAVNQAQVTISTLTLERDQWKAQASQTGNNSQLQQQVQSLSQQVQGLTNDKASLTQQVTVLNQTIADLRTNLASAQNTSTPNTPVTDAVPLPTIKDITDQLPTHKVNRYATRPLNAITHLTFHHSAAPGNVPIENIARYHVTGNNWPGIGYHFCIEPDGTVYQVNKLETMAYHAGAVNGYTIGICVEGNFTGGAIPTPLQIQSAGHLAAWLASKFKIPVERIMGHKEFADEASQNNTQCPGDDWTAGQNWKQMLHDRVRAVLAGQLATPAKSIGHYLLFWQRADMWAKEDFAAAANYIARFRPTIGFSPDDARNARYVTIVGGVAGVPFETEQALRTAECKVERLAGLDFADTKRMLDDLAQRGQPFQTLNS